MTAALAEFSHHLGGLLPEVGSDRLPALMVHMLKALVKFDQAMILRYTGSEPPVVYYNDLPASDQVSQIERFVSGPYLLDPFYHAAVDDGLLGLFRLGELAPDAFEKSEYYRSYFKHTTIKDEVGYLISLSPDHFINISIGRERFSPKYNRKEIRILEDILPTIEALCRAQWGDRPENKPEGENRLPSQLDSALKHFGTAFLTERESQVVQLFLHGHSTKSIAERLGISPETVKLHRKNSYAKLDVSSQAELFHLFIDSLASLDNYQGGDPLVGYL